MPKTHKQRTTRSENYYPYVGSKLREFGCHAVPIPPGTKRCLVKGWPEPFSEEKFKKMVR